MEEWKPKRSLEEVERIVRGPGSTYEVELAIIDERVLRVYKNLPPVRYDVSHAKSALIYAT